MRKTMSRISQPTPDHRRPQPLVPGRHQPQVAALCAPARRGTTRQRKRPGWGHGNRTRAASIDQPIAGAPATKSRRNGHSQSIIAVTTVTFVPAERGRGKAGSRQTFTGPGTGLAACKSRVVSRPVKPFVLRERGRDSSPHLAGGGVRPMPRVRCNTPSLRCTLAKSLISFITYTLLLCA